MISIKDFIMQKLSRIGLDIFEIEESLSSLEFELIFKDNMIHIHFDLVYTSEEIRMNIVNILSSYIKEYNEHNKDFYYLYILEPYIKIIDNNGKFIDLILLDSFDVSKEELYKMYESALLNKNLKKANKFKKIKKD